MLYQHPSDTTISPANAKPKLWKNLKLVLAAIAIGLTPILNAMSAHAQGPPTVGEPAMVAPIQMTEEERRTLAATLVGEALYEDAVGMMLVGEVILQRVANKHMGDSTIYTVAHRDRQFSCWNADYKWRPLLAKLEAGEPSGAKSFDQAYAMALDVVDRLATGERTGSLPDRTHHYYNPKVVNPKWGEKDKIVLIYQNHVFMAGIP